MYLERSQHEENTQYNTHLSKWYQTKVLHHKALMPCLANGNKTIASKPKKYILLENGIMEDNSLRNDEVLKKLKELGINNIKSERTLQDQIKKGLGPKPLRHSTGEGTYNEHGPTAFAELYASNKCMTGRMKVKLAAFYRKIALSFCNNPLSFYLDDDFWKDKMQPVFRWIAYREKAINKIENYRFFDIVFYLNECGYVEKKEVVHKDSDDHLIMILKEAGIKNTVSIILTLPDGVTRTENVFIF